MKKNVLFIIIIILLLGVLGFGGYKYMELEKDNDILINENKTITEELNKQKEESEKASATNDYSSFVKKMKESRESLNNAIGLGEMTSNPFINEKIEKYGIGLTKTGELSVENKKIASNVLFYRAIFVGNGGFRGLFYVTEDGKVYIANVEESLYNKETIKIKEIKGVKEIVNIIPSGAEDGQDALFVDINGNILTGAVSD